MCNIRLPVTKFFWSSEIVYKVWYKSEAFNSDPRLVNSYPKVSFYIRVQIKMSKFDVILAVFGDFK